MKKFENRNKAVARIWKALQRLNGHATPEDAAPEPASAAPAGGKGAPSKGKSGKKSTPAKKAPKPLFGKTPGPRGSGRSGLFCGCGLPVVQHVQGPGVGVGTVRRAFEAGVLKLPARGRGQHGMAERARAKAETTPVAKVANCLRK